MEQSLLCVGKGVMFSKLSREDFCDTPDTESEREDRLEVLIAFPCGYFSSFRLASYRLVDLCDS